MEMRPLAERCLVGFVEGPPMEPGLYNNFVRVVQTSDYVVILNEMIHDARIVRIEAEHVDTAIRRWLGDSVGRWEGDTLVIETQNFRDETGVRYLGASRHMKVTERLTPSPGGICGTPSPSTTRPSGPPRGAETSSGRGPRRGSSSTPATKGTTLWATSCGGLASSSRTLEGRSE